MNFTSVRKMKFQTKIFSKEIWNSIKWSNADLDEPRHSLESEE